MAGEGLVLDGLSLRQGDFALRAEFTVPRGAIIAVIGPSGGGKSTLLSAVAGFLAPVSGRVLWEGKDLAGIAPGDRPVAILFQDANHFPHLTVAQNVGLALRPALRLQSDEAARVQDVLARVGLGGMGGRRPGDLSGGQQSRAALARALVSSRPLVLLDEPFAALGPSLRAEMLDLAAQTLGADGRTLLMVTHAPEDAARIADSIIVVEGGVAAAPRETQALLADPPPGLRDYLG